MTRKIMCHCGDVKCDKWSEIDEPNSEWFKVYCECGKQMFVLYSHTRQVMESVCGKKKEIKNVKIVID